MMGCRPVRVRSPLMAVAAALCLFAAPAAARADCIYEGGDAYAFVSATCHPEPQFDACSDGMGHVMFLSGIVYDDWSNETSPDSELVAAVRDEWGVEVRGPNFRCFEAPLVARSAWLDAMAGHNRRGAGYQTRHVVIPDT